MLTILDTEPRTGRRTSGAVKNYDTKTFVVNCRKRHVTPHVVQSRRVVGESVIPVHGGGLQPGPDAAIIGVAHPKSAQKAKK